MRTFLSERNIVVVLFVMVLITFSLAHEDTKKMEHIYMGAATSVTVNLIEPPVDAPETIPSSRYFSLNPAQ